MFLSNSAVLRPATLADLSELVELCAAHAAYERQEFVRDGAAERVQQSLFGPGARLECIVAEREGQLVGYATHSDEASTWNGTCFTHMDCLFVRDGQRGQRIGERLVRAVAAAAVGRGHREVQWQTPDWNTDAARFYARLGATSKSKLRFSLDARAAAASDDVPFVDQSTTGSASLEGFELRRASFVGLRHGNGWTLKVHALAAAPEGVAPDVLEAACDVALAALPVPAATSGRFGVGFVVLHAGLEGIWLLVDWWCAGDILRQRLFWAPVESPHRFSDVIGTDLHACVHEMKVIEAETRAWVETVLARPDERDLEGYLARTS